MAAVLDYRMRSTVAGVLWEKQRELRRRGRFLAAFKLRQLLDSPEVWSQALEKMEEKAQFFATQARAEGKELGDGQLLEMLLNWLLNEGGLELLLKLFMGGLF